MSMIKMPQYGICLDDDAFEPFIDELFEMDYSSCRDLVEAKKFLGSRDACEKYEEIEIEEIDENSSLGEMIAKYFPVLFRAEYIAEANPNLCNGCRACIHSCQFDAIRYSIAHEKIDIDPLRCYGCGICRAGCIKDAITLSERATVPVAANLW